MRGLRGRSCNRRTFVRAGVGAAAGASLPGCAPGSRSASTPPATVAPNPGHPVSIVAADSYDSIEVHEALARALELIGGVADLVRGRSVAIKVNLPGSAVDLFGRPPGETYATHDVTLHALVRLLQAAGASLVTVVESAGFRGRLEDWAALYGWNVRALEELGVGFENTRNLGRGSSYVRLPVPDGRMFSYFDVNHAYADNDVVVSLAKLKNHVSAGVTLSLKNMFGITPTSLYGVEAPGEHAIGYRGVLHRRSEGGVPELPGELPGFEEREVTFRVPNVTTDIVAARPVHLAVVDGIRSIAGGEGPWTPDDLRPMQTGVMLMGRDAVSVDAVATAVMGYADPLSTRLPPFDFCENHLRLAHEAGLGNADLSRIDVAGLAVDQVRQPFAWL